jgi:outer membrane protein assembly factor BamB
MKKLAYLLILGLVLLPAQGSTRAAAPSSDWPSLNADAAQSNDNAAEQTLTAHNVLKLKVRWTYPRLNAPPPFPVLADVSYPVVENGRVYVPVMSHGKVHVHVLDAATGKRLAVFPKDAAGGMLALGASLYLAGHILQEVDATTGEKLGQFDATPQVNGGTFLNPVTDQKVMVAGYASASRGTQNRLYGIDPGTKAILWKIPSISAEAALGAGHVLTETSSGSEFYDESSGKGLASQRSVYSDWFAGSSGMAYTVATVKRGKATLYAFDQSGHRIWKRAIGPYMIAAGWPHAVSAQTVYVQTFKPNVGVEALDAATGRVLWRRAVPNVQRLVLANNLLFILSSALGQPARIVVLHANNGAPLGAIVLSSGYYTFSERNGLIVADGMVFIRAVGPGNTQVLVALGL